VEVGMGWTDNLKNHHPASQDSLSSYFSLSTTEILTPIKYTHYDIEILISKIKCGNVFISIPQK
jgi:hypothetical protein